MTDYYLRSSDGVDGYLGTPSEPFAGIASGVASMVAGDRLYISDTHYEDYSAGDIIIDVGTNSNPCEFLCIEDWGAETNPVNITHTLVTSPSGEFGTSGSTLNDPRIYGYTYWYGVRIHTSFAIYLLVSNNGYAKLENCYLRFNRNSYNTLSCGVASHQKGTLVELIDVTLDAPINALSIAPLCPIYMYGGKVISNFLNNTNPGFNPNDTSGALSDMKFFGVDFSEWQLDIALVDLTPDKNARWFFQNCKMPSGVPLTSGSITGPGTCSVEFVNCDYIDTNYKYYYEDFSGTIQDETTNVRTGGASDGTTTFSRIMESSPEASYTAPLNLECNRQWNETVGSELTTTVEIMNSGLQLTNKQVWAEVEYLGSGIPISLFANDGVDILHSGDIQATSSETWDDTGLGTIYKQKLEVSFTPELAGPIRTRVKLAAPSTSIYVCPKVNIA